MTTLYQTAGLPVQDKAKTTASASVVRMTAGLPPTDVYPWFYKRDLDITVVDHNGDAVEDAIVSVRQNEGHELAVYATDAAGEIGTQQFVEWEEESLGVIDQWSDGSDDDHKHTICVIKTGYLPWIRQVAFTENRTITAVLFGGLHRRIVPPA